MSKHDLVIVEWLDHHTSNSWQEVAEIDHEPALVRTVGWLLRDDEVGVTVCNTISDDQMNINGAFFLMRSCVRKIKTLRRVRKAKVVVVKGEEK